MTIRQQGYRSFRIRTASCESLWCGRVRLSPCYGLREQRCQTSCRAYSGGWGMRV